MQMEVWEQSEINLFINVCASTVIIVYIIICPWNSYLYIHWILDFK